MSISTSLIGSSKAPGWRNNTDCDKEHLSFDWDALTNDLRASSSEAAAESRDPEVAKQLQNADNLLHTRVSDMVRCPERPAIFDVDEMSPVPIVDDEHATAVGIGNSENTKTHIKLWTEIFTGDLRIPGYYAVAVSSQPETVKTAQEMRDARDKSLINSIIRPAMTIKAAREEKLREILSDTSLGDEEKAKLVATLAEELSDINSCIGNFVHTSAYSRFLLETGG